jgi:signal transduction histidine kinase
MKLTKTLSSLLIGFLFSIIVFGGAIFFTYKSEDNLFIDFNEIERVHSIIDKTKSVTNLISRVEASVRGFGISKNEIFIKDYNQDVVLLKTNLTDLEKIISDNPTQLKKVDNLKLLLDKNLANLDNKISSLKGDSGKVDDLSFQEGLQLSSGILDLEKSIIVEQQLVLSEKRNAAIKDLKKAKLTIEIIGSSALAMSILIIVFFFEYAKTHAKVESELVELNENKNKFFSIISHDLRNPVKNIVLMAQLLTEQAGAKSYDPIKIATMIQGSANNLSSLLDNLLKWSRLQMNKIEFIPEKLDLKKVTDDVIRHQGVNAGQKSITIKNNIQTDLYVNIDQNVLTTVLRNIISNGIKFTEKGGQINVDAAALNGAIEVIISDTGVGMPKEIVDKIFSIDFKHSTKGTNKEEGTGLGLKLVKEFIEKNSGKVSAESVVNKGSKFILTIPAA